MLITTSVLNTGHIAVRVRQRAACGSGCTSTCESPGLADNDTGNDLYNPRSPWLAYNSHGDGVAVWRAESSEEIYSARYAVADNQWTTPVLVRAGGTGVDGLSVAINDAGEAAAIWNNSSGFYGASMAGQASPGASWGAAHPVMVSGPHLVMPQIQADQAGNFVGAWQEFSFFDASVMPIAISRTLRPSTDTLSGMPAEDGDPETGENIADTFGGAPTLAVNTAGTMVASAMYLGESFSPNAGAALSAGAPPVSRGSTEATMAWKMFGTPAITCTLRKVNPGATEIGLSISTAPSGMRAMRWRASLKAVPWRS